MGLTKYVIHGGRPLYGRVPISGAKNAAVAIIPAALLIKGVCRIENVPQISDVTVLLDILSGLGANIRRLDAHTVEIDCTHLCNARISDEVSRRCRASYYLLGALLGRFGQADVAMPGGCNFGTRPIDQHIKGFTALGAQVDVQNGCVCLDTPQPLAGASIFLDKVSVGATINIMLAAALTPGLTVIENAAKEPHVVDVANFLNTAGADIMGAGTDVIKIRGVSSLHDATYSIIPDQIEAGTYMAAVAACGGEVRICNIIPKHMDCITAKMKEIGVEVLEEDDDLLVSRHEPLQRANIKTMPYPGFPTDMQPQIVAVLSLAKGTSMVTESVYDNRFRYVDEFKRLGAQIQVDGKVAVIEGKDHLTGATMQACDLRAGAAMLVAALAAEGKSEISCVQYIERGYEDIVGKLRDLGADIVAVEEPAEFQTAHVG